MLKQSLKLKNGNWDNPIYIIGFNIKMTYSEVLVGPNYESFINKELILPKYPEEWPPFDARLIGNYNLKEILPSHFISLWLTSEPIKPNANYDGSQLIVCFLTDYNYAKSTILNIAEYVKKINWKSDAKDFIIQAFTYNEKIRKMKEFNNSF